MAGVSGGGFAGGAGGFGSGRVLHYTEGPGSVGPPPPPGYVPPSSGTSSEGGRTSATRRAGGGGAGGRVPGDAAATGVGNTSNFLESWGQGMMDPNSDYYKRMIDRLQKTVGAQTAGANRSAALASAESGFGAGMNPQQAEMIQGNEMTGQRAMGEGAGNIAIQAPQLGLSAALGGGNLGMDLARLNEGASEFGRSLGENQRQFDVGSGFQAQQLAQAADAQAFQQKLAQNQDMLRMFSMMYGSL